VESWVVAGGAGGAGVRRVNSRQGVVHHSPNAITASAAPALGQSQRRARRIGVRVRTRDMTIGLVGVLGPAGCAVPRANVLISCRIGSS